MCNINLILRKDGKKDSKIAECMNIVTYLSFNHNDDGEGYFTEKFKIKTSPNKIIYKGEHSMIVTHQRLATSGKNEKMIQPLESDTFIIAHNGVFSGLGKDAKSDTFLYLKKIEEQYKKTKDIKKTLDNVCSDIFGSYSVVLYNKKTKEFLYYKNQSTSMFVSNGTKYLLMSTDKDNIEYMKKYLDVRADVYEPEALELLNIRNNLKKVADIEITYTTQNSDCGVIDCTSRKKVRTYQDYLNSKRNTNVGYDDEEDDWFDDCAYMGSNKAVKALLTDDDRETDGSEDEFYRIYDRFETMSKKQQAVIRNEVLTFLHGLLRTGGVEWFTTGMHKDFVAVSVRDEDTPIVETYFPAWMWWEKKENEFRNKVIYNIDLISLLQEIPNINKIYEITPNLSIN